MDKFPKYSLIKYTGFTPRVLAVIVGFGNLALGAHYKYSEIASWIEPLRLFGNKLFLASAQGWVKVNISWVSCQTSCISRNI